MPSLQTEAKIVVVLGTRPEGIKLCPLITALQREEVFNVRVVNTGQHREMLYPVLRSFQVVPDYNLEIMTTNQTIAEITARCLRKLQKVYKDFPPDMVLVQGDTTSAMAAALAAYYERHAVGHVEAGLRTYNPYSPFPEEINRRIVGVIASLHFAPTNLAKDRLIREGVNPHSVFITGNTAIDALRLTIDPNRKFTDTKLRNIDFLEKKVVVLTTHRRESFGKPMADTMSAVAELVKRREDIEVVFPVHMNPKVRKLADEILSGRDRVHLVEPMEYSEFVQLLDRCYLVITDSGGIQEEVPSLGKPVLVTRETTERPEGIAAGCSVLVGTEKSRILQACLNLLVNKDAYQNMALRENPYGDGRASERIVDILKTHFNVQYMEPGSKAGHLVYEEGYALNF